MTRPRVLIAAGGTGGHVFPALAVAQELQRRGWHADWVGTDRGLESRVVPNAGIALHLLRFTGLRGKGLGAWLSLPMRLLRAAFEAKRILVRTRPHVVVAFGGYVTFPVGLMARGSSIPLCLHEQNAVMGTANRWLSKIAQVVMVSFPKTRHAPGRAALAGNPVRASISRLPPPALRYADHAGPLRLLVIGGSLGARAINQVLPEAMSTALTHGTAFSVRHQTGQHDLAEVVAAYKAKKIDAVCTAFIEDMTEAYAWADLVICRAGASTVSEISAVGLAAVFIPLPHAIDDHQRENARYLSDADAGWLLDQAALTASGLAALLQTMDRPMLIERAQRAHAKAMQLADHVAADLVVALTQKTRQGVAA
jgi:UDP-N-acetylglucosamine--N-acetylmuramyl-(pentapeptide) pyrophosphoryl-undecaprenol N-acetylglucosamine transferase